MFYFKFVELGKVHFWTRQVWVQFEIVWINLIHWGPYAILSPSLLVSLTEGPRSPASPHSIPSSSPFSQSHPRATRCVSADRCRPPLPRSDYGQVSDPPTLLHGCTTHPCNQNPPFFSPWCRMSSEPQKESAESRNSRSRRSQLKLKIGIQAEQVQRMFGDPHALSCEDTNIA
jgi:hypothetical protein